MKSLTQKTKNFAQQLNTLSRRFGKYYFERLWITTIFDLKPPNLHTYSHQLLGFTIVSRQDAIMRFNVVLFVIISCGLELAVFIHGQHYYYPVAPPSLHCLKKHCDQIVTGKVITYKSRGEVSLVEQETIEFVRSCSLSKIHIKVSTQKFMVF